MMKTLRKVSFTNTAHGVINVMVTDYANNSSFDHMGVIEDMSAGNGLKWRVRIDGEQYDTFVDSARVAQFFAIGLLESDNELAN